MGASPGPSARSARAVACLAAALTVFAGCATVRPAERGALADPLMALPGEEPLAESWDAHWLGAREAAAGGWGAASAGCGCR